MIGPSPDRLQAQFIYGSGGFPSAPLNLTVTYNAGTDAFDFEWDAPVSDGGSPLTEYNFYVNDVVINSPADPFVSFDNGNQVSEGDEIYVTAVNAIGESVASNTVIATISSDSPGIWGGIFGGIWGGIYGRSA